MWKGGCRKRLRKDGRGDELLQVATYAMDSTRHQYLHMKMREESCLCRKRMGGPLEEHKALRKDETCEREPTPSK